MIISLRSIASNTPNSLTAPASVRLHSRSIFIDSLLPPPLPADDEVLIRVRAASVNPLDGHMLKTAPFARNLAFSMLGQRVKRPGADLAGEVEAVGRNVTRFKPGDAVFGASGGGGFAEYACPPESRLAKMPANVDFETAACVNVAGRTALQGLRDIANVQAGQKVLINGASGGIGTFAVQIAKWLGADVTGVCSTQNVDLVRRLGADHVIDYTREDFTRGDERYDVIYDLVGDKPLLALRSVLKPKGIYVGAGVLGKEASMIRMLAGMFNAALLSLFTKQKFISFMTKSNTDDLPVLAGIMETGKVKPVIDRTFSLNDVAEAVHYVDAKHARGKVVISVGGPLSLHVEAENELSQLWITNARGPAIDRRYRLSEVAEAIAYLKKRHARGKVIIAMEDNNEI